MSPVPSAILLTSITMLAATTLDPTLIAAAVVTIIAALGGVTVQIINARSAATDRREAARREETAAQERKALYEQSQRAIDKADTLVTTTSKIHELTNSTNSNLQKALELMTEKHAGQEKLIRQMEAEKQTTAANRAVADAHAAAVSALPADSVITKVAEKALTSIDSNTAAIEKNTAKTDATVQEMSKEQKS